MSAPASSTATAASTPRSSPGPSATGRIVVGLLLVGGGLMWLLDRLDVIDVPAQAVPAAGLIVVGAALVALAWDPAGHGGLVALGVALTVVALVISTVPVLLDVPLSAGVGDRTVIAENLEQVDDEALAVGTLQLDLRDVRLGETAVPPLVESSVGIGELRVVVPADAAVQVEAEAGMGAITVFGDRRDGIAVDGTWETPDWDRSSRRLRLRLSTGIGEVEVAR